MNKFTIVGMPVQEKEDNAILYKVHIGTKYYLHKGKVLKESVDKLLDDVFRGIRGLKCDDRYSRLVEYCNRYPAVNKVMVEVILNSDSSKILALEDKMYKSMKKDELSLNNLEIPPYKPEWMLRDKFSSKCDDCIKKGVINGSIKKFNFCPVCGRANK